MSNWYNKLAVIHAISRYFRATLKAEKVDEKVLKSAGAKIWHHLDAWNPIEEVLCGMHNYFIGVHWLKNPSTAIALKKYVHSKSFWFYVLTFSTSPWILWGLVRIELCHISFASSISLKHRLLLVVFLLLYFINRISHWGKCCSANPKRIKWQKWRRTQ